MSNKSKAYGYYGGVRDQNTYTPPPSVPFVPQPAKLPFFETYAQTLEPFTNLDSTTIQFLSAEQPYFMRRYLEDRVGEVESYKIDTAINPNDLLTYDTGLSGAENIFKMDGGLF